jgi:hypothetical protein
LGVGAEPPPGLGTDACDRSDATLITGAGRRSF